MIERAKSRERAREAAAIGMLVIAFGPIATAIAAPAPSSTSTSTPTATATATATATSTPTPTRDAGLARIPPDPSPLFERSQWVFDLRYAKGDLFFLAVHRIDLGAPQLTPRAMGRFALELFEGPTLIERVRFDFPFLGAGESSADAGAGLGGRPPPSFEAKLVTRVGVMFPATKKGTRLELWDRATGHRWPLAWPPEDTRAESAHDAGDGG